MLSIICFSLAGICLAGSIASLVVAIRRKKQIPQRKEDMTRQQKEPANPDANWYLENIYEELRNLS